MGMKQTAAHARKDCSWAAGEGVSVARLEEQAVFSIRRRPEQEFQTRSQRRLR